MKIAAFISNHTVATICCVAETYPHCFNCFYVFNEQDMLLIFKSSEKSRHVQSFKDNSCVAGTILGKRNTALNNQGIQFEGIIQSEHTLSRGDVTRYYRHYPFAIVMKGSLFAVKLTTLHMTCSVNGTRDKYAWHAVDAGKMPV